MHLAFEPLASVHIPSLPSVGAGFAHFMVFKIPFVHITVLKLKDSTTAKAVVGPLTIINRASGEKIFTPTMALPAVPPTHIFLFSGVVEIHPEPMLQVRKPIALRERERETEKSSEGGRKRCVIAMHMQK